MFQRSGGSGNNLCQVLFDDASTTPFSTATAARAPYTGTWKPFEPLNGLLNASTDGDWKLTVTDGGVAGHRLGARGLARVDGVRQVSAFSAASTSASVL